MRDNMTPEVLNAISAQVITTALLARLDFKSETVFVWTGAYTIQPIGSGDSLLDGHVFEPIAEGVLVDIGENTFTLDGSGELKMTLAVPTAPSIAIASSQVYPNEYQARQATIWRALKLPSSDPLAAPVWSFRKIRSGAMDKVEIQNDGLSHNFMLTIESHQSLITNATNQTYLDQKRYDLADTSQDYAASIANGDPAPTKSSYVNQTPTQGGGGFMKGILNGVRLAQE